MLRRTMMSATTVNRVSHRALWFTVALAALSSCNEQFDEPYTGYGPVTATVMQYNVAGGDTLRDYPWKGENIATHISTTAPDFVAVQECGPCEQLLAHLSEAYQLTAEPQSGVAIVYDALAWDVDDQGVLELGDNDDGWGRRVATWARFVPLDDQHPMYVVSTHYCVTIRTEDDACTEDRQLAYTRAVLDFLARRFDPKTPVAFAGDLNVFDGFEHGRVLELLRDRGFVDVFRELDADSDGTTFQGNSWAPAGRIDYILASSPVDALAASVERDALADGQGSDHYATVATVAFSGSE